MPTLLDAHIAHDGAATAIADAAGRTSWTTLGERVHRWMHVLAGRGLRAGDRLVCVLGNRRETFEVLLAGLHSGVTVVPANWHLTAAELRYLLADSEARAVVTEDGYLPAVIEALVGLPGPAAVPVRMVLGDAAPAGFVAAEPLLAAASAAAPADQCCGDTMLYTSGTTGVPKGVVNGLFVNGAPFRRVGRLLDYARVVLGVAPRERFLLDAPWYHSSQLFFALIALLLGNRLVIRPRFDPRATLAVIDAEQISSAHFVPTQLIRLLREQDAGGFSGASLRRVWHGGGPCPPDVKRRMIDWWGPVFLEYYGATEGGAVTLISSREWLRRPGSVGRAVLPNEVHILDGGGVPLPAGEVGRVFVRRRSGRTFQYHNAPEKTRAAHHAGDMFTFGELGRLDTDGYLYLTGRAQDLIVTGGVNVYPAEVEAVLLTHPAVRDAAVIGVPDDEYGERVLAVVEAQPGHEASLGEVLDVHCRRSLAGFKAPRAYEFVGRLPREATGKIRKDVLRERGPSPTAPPAAERSPTDAIGDHRRADASRHR